MPSLLFAFSFIFIGALGGIIIGVLGTGSSLIILPTLNWVLPNIFPADLAMRFAVGTCIASLSVGALSGSLTYIRQKQFNSKIFVLGLPAVTFGSFLAPQLSLLIPSSLLKIYIGLFLMVISVYKLLSKTNDRSASTTPNGLYILATCFISALASGLAGVALGILLIPALTRFLNHREAVGTSIVLAAIYAILTTLGYILAGLGEQRHSIEIAESVLPANIGYVYLPAFILIALPIFIFPVLGEKISRALPTKRLEQTFYSFLFLAGSSFLIN